ncbi:hypothetical protein CSPX01_14635 [Colletotrichum filicis]|nr:hypothetical protein CSPX01_14635 [Colletotrichum filicis]
MARLCPGLSMVTGAYLVLGYHRYLVLVPVVGVVAHVLPSWPSWALLCLISSSPSNKTILPVRVFLPFYLVPHLFLFCFPTSFYLLPFLSLPASPSLIGIAFHYFHTLTPPQATFQLPAPLILVSGL